MRKNEYLHFIFKIKPQTSLGIKDYNYICCAPAQTFIFPGILRFKGTVNVISSELQSKELHGQ